MTLLHLHPNPILLAPSAPPLRSHWLSFSSRTWTSAGSQPSRPRVLVIDDDRSLLSLLRAIFLSAGFEVSTCPDGESALGEVERFKPSTIVLDLEMPVMNGRTFFRELRAREDKTPVLILSAFGARTAQLELGAEGYTSKPFDPDDLVEAVRRLIKSGG